jgi:stage V sporulation protein SpoVS
LIVEVKRHGALAWNQRSVDAALAQAHRYADERASDQVVQPASISSGNAVIQ